MAQRCSESRFHLVMRNDNMAENRIALAMVVQKIQNYHCAVGKSFIICV